MKKLIGAMTIVAGLAFGDAGDPPARVARLNYVNGSVSFQPAGVQDWMPATINYPMTTGDNLWVDANSRAELHIGSTAIHVDANTAAAFLNLDDRTVQVRLSQGSISLRIRYMADDEVYEVDTPNGAISLLRTGAYRIDANPDTQTTAITVRSGEAEVTAGGAAFAIHPRQTGILTGTNPPAQESRPAGPFDIFDNWCMERERREDDRPSAKYVSRELPGYEDLDDHGTWRPYPGYGMVWYPNVQPGWAPYHYGHWRWIEPWGWTWVDDAPWGFAPFHYGRWASGGGVWFWVPGPGIGPAPVMVAGGPRVVVVRPVYAPALVAFVGGANWSVSLGIGGGGGVAWFPLGPREVFVPSYHVSPAYVNRVNVVNVATVTNVTNVTNVRYVNQTVPGAVTAVSRADFTSAAPVHRAAFQVPPSAIATAPVAGSAPAIAPTAQSVAPVTRGAFVPKPPAAVASQAVVTKAAPPPAPVPFAARQSALTANPGRPVDPSTLSTLRRTTPVTQPAPRSAPTTPAVTNSGFGRPNTTTPTPPSTTVQPSSVNRPSEAQREQLRQQQPVHPAVTPSSPQPHSDSRSVQHEQPSEKHPSKKKDKEQERKER